MWKGRPRLVLEPEMKTRGQTMVTSLNNRKDALAVWSTNRLRQHASMLPSPTAAQEHENGEERVTAFSMMSKGQPSLVLARETKT